VQSLQAAVEEAGKDVAAILVMAFRHDMGRDLDLANEGIRGSRSAACDAADAALIIDEVRAGLRLDVRGSWEALGVRPDLCAWSKAIANGYALAAVTGNDRFREAATKVFVTGSFWCGTVAMAAARATLRIACETDVPGHIRATGLRLRDGLASLAKEHGIAIRQSGPPQMPLMLFEDDAEVRKGRAFCSAALRHGAFFHPQHNMFLSLAHRPADIDEALQAASHSFEAVRDLEARSNR
jgi:glutamate-1-semialdehyde 2,1-aminomutase